MVEGIHVIDEPAPSYALDARIGADGFWDELWMTGSYFEQTAATYCPLGGLGRLSVVGKPIVAFRIRSISGGNSGYDPGAASDYILMADIHAKYLACATLAHEMGHKLGLPDCCGPGNLMYNGTCDGLDLKDWQVNLARNSEYSSYV
jgi:hypothetical protein